MTLVTTNPEVETGSTIIGGEPWSLGRAAAMMAKASGIGGRRPEQPKPIRPTNGRGKKLRHDKFRPVADVLAEAVESAPTTEPAMLQTEEEVPILSVETETETVQKPICTKSWRNAVVEPLIENKFFGFVSITGLNEQAVVPTKLRKQFWDTFQEGATPKIRCFETERGLVVSHLKFD